MALPELTEDPQALTAAARAYLRDRFLKVNVGVSGANFAVAESGAVCVVESEGNGRMCVTLPDALITLIGIEKVIPRFSDLEVFLQLLPRSATGERMNPYNSLWTGVAKGRWAAGVPRDPAGQRPHQDAGRRDRARDAGSASAAARA
jgi:L-lactate dehydrogenase complex protein LldF